MKYCNKPPLASHYVDSIRDIVLLLLLLLLLLQNYENLLSADMF